MSDIKMCDNCGEIFSVNARGWEQYEKQFTERVPESSHEVVRRRVQMHMCPDCASGNVPFVKPRISAVELEKGSE